MSLQSDIGLNQSYFPNPRVPPPKCVTGPLPGFLPNWLTVDCASRMNFRLYRKNLEALGLAGVDSMTFVRAKIGAYGAGNLFLFPWLSPKGRAQQIVWPSVAPTDSTQFILNHPIPSHFLPQDEHLCNWVLQAPSLNFIGFQVRAPFGKGRAKLPWVTNVTKTRQWRTARHQLDQAAAIGFQTTGPATGRPGARSSSRDRNRRPSAPAERARRRRK